MALIPVANEPIIRSSTRGTWEYVFDTEDRMHKYLHRECDMTEENGHCIGCGAPCPTLWTGAPEVNPCGALQ